VSVNVAGFGGKVSASQSQDSGGQPAWLWPVVGIAGSLLVGLLLKGR